MTPHGSKPYKSYIGGIVMSLFGDLMGSLAGPPIGRNRRISSNEQPNWNDGNFDMTPIPPGEVLEMPVLKGPGVINHIWLTSHAGGANELNALSLRIYWDDSDEPGVEVPLGDFFAVGQSPEVVDSFPVQVSPSGSLSCYWRMPFAESARIVVTNDNPDRRTGLYWQVDWVELNELPPDTPYFYAKYRREYPAVMDQDYLIADIEGCGQYVGTVMSITMSQDGWFGEGDDFFYIDGEEIPSLQGTGSEDYFNDAWGFRQRTSPWFGQPRWQGYRAGDNGICYRWHILDPVGFRESLKVTIEHKGNRENSEEAWYIERPDFISSIAYWYQIGKPKPFAELPSYKERCVPWENFNLVRKFTKAEIEGKGELKLQAVGLFGGRPSLQWKAMEAGATLAMPFEVSKEGRYAVRLVTFSSPEHGVYDIELDGEKIYPEANFCTDSFEETDLLLGTHQLSKGQHKLTFRALPSSDEIKPMALELLKLLNLPPEVDREVKTHNEAHFIRLGIGRAVFAYR
ncbi:DUF2961 domain-containing protein, partial [Candidatus Poribacteria bacterium]|nr:DUF2961 domain-containing protein [Candidatus Poribacteria bacterium]